MGARRKDLSWTQREQRSFAGESSGSRTGGHAPPVQEWRQPSVDPDMEDLVNVGAGLPVLHGAPHQRGRQPVASELEQIATSA
jgi:hypothetical protein